jgi:hypothetical protein
VIAQAEGGCAVEQVRVGKAGLIGEPCPVNEQRWREQAAGAGALLPAPCSLMGAVASEAL